MELVADIEARRGAAVEVVAAVGPRRGQRVRVLDAYWAAVRRDDDGGPAAGGVDWCGEEEREGLYDREAFNVFMSNAGFEGGKLTGLWESLDAAMGAP